MKSEILPQAKSLERVEREKGKVLKCLKSCKRSKYCYYIYYFKVDNFRSSCLTKILMGDYFFFISILIYLKLLPSFLF